MAGFGALAGQAMSAMGGAGGAAGGAGGIGGLLGKVGGGAGKTMAGGGMGPPTKAGATGPAPGSQGGDPMGAAGKQAAADKSQEDMMKAMQAADAAGKPGQSYTDMGGLLGMGLQGAGNSQQNIAAMQGNSRAKMYQQMMMKMNGGM